MPPLIPNNPENTPLLAKLSSRGQGLERFAAEVERGQRESNHLFSVLLVQFDGLSRLTDRVGRASDNNVWRQVLDILTGDLTPDLCARLGGDDFLLILPGRGESECGALVDRLRRRWAAAANMREAMIEMSVGIALYPAHGTTVRELFAAADEAMQADKDRNQK